MSMTNASATGDVSRIATTQSQDALAGGGSPYQAITITRSYEGVVRQIAASIRNGQIGNGGRLPTERELSAAFGVSRGVIREAIKVLGALGLVEARQGSGIYVLNTVPTVTRAFTLSVSPDAESVVQLFEFRRTLESDSARLASLRRSEAERVAIEAAAEATAQALESNDWSAFGIADNEFHAAIARASGNPFFEVAVATARQMQQDVVPLIGDRAGSMRSAVVHHREIARAIGAQAPEAAARAMTDHIALHRQRRGHGEPARRCRRPGRGRHERASVDPKRAGLRADTGQADLFEQSDLLGDRGEILGVSAADSEPDSGGGGRGLSGHQRRPAQLPRIPAQPAGAGHALDRARALRDMLDRPDVRIAMKNTLIWVTFGALSQFILGMITALALHRSLQRLRASLRCWC